MKCPSCQKELKKFCYGLLELDACEDGCGGIWFDQAEIDKIDEKSEYPSASILSLAKRKESVKVASSQKNCPRCSGERLVRQFFDPKHEVEIDQCWSCAGIWLDVGEINTVRSQFNTIEDRARAVNLYIEDRLQLTKKEMAAEMSAQIERYNEQTSNRFKAALYAFKQLLGLDEQGDSL